MDPALHYYLSVAITGMMALQTLGMVWAAYETRGWVARYPSFHNSWTRLFLVICWPLCLLLWYVIRRF